MKGLEASGFSQPTEIQSRAIPVATDGRDLLASAQTGTGKTAAFVLPALQRLLTAPPKKGRGPRVLVLTPTRELAVQVEQVIRQIGRYTGLRSGVIVGGVSYGPQERMLRNGLDLLVATPGRLIDHITQGLAVFSRLEMFVLDEADRMLDMGFVKPVMRIAAELPAGRQSLLFSATLEGDVQKIAGRLLTKPARISLATAKVRHEAITQRLYLTDTPERKHTLLRQLLDDPTMTQAIVFTATKRGADRLAKRLTGHGHSCAPLHGNMRQGARQRTVESLRSGKVRILVATDVAARGIDLLGVSHVINFDLPTVAEDYIHRIGRTGRNGATGTAISLVGPLDRVKLGNIERLTGYRLEREESAAPEPPAATATDGERPSQRPPRQTPKRASQRTPHHPSHEVQRRQPRRRRIAQPRATA
ncbi:MAG: DEAD/DEAH box helicase [SAR324 cluster bacterium]|nr:DEAD/DEAH box helicase [SAR324 cluster bacterium]